MDTQCFGVSLCWEAVQWPLALNWYMDMHIAEQKNLETMRLDVGNITSLTRDSQWMTMDTV